MGAFRVKTSDGLELAVTDFGGPGDERPTIVAVHGYPDNQGVWLPIVQRLGAEFRLVTYDVRGAGGSDVPDSRAGYLIEQLNRDLATVIDTVSPDKPVHLLAHDWGSIQTWEAVAGNVPAERILSYTSISGPSLDQAGVWLKGVASNGLDGARKRLIQMVESYYVWFFQAPKLPEAGWRSGLLDRVVGAGAKRGRPEGVEVPHVERTEKETINGVELYRANVLPRLRKPDPRPITVPVQVISPAQDVYVSRPLATEAPAPYVEDLTISNVEGGHWIVLDQPDLIAGLIRDFVTKASK